MPRIPGRVRRYAHVLASSLLLSCGGGGGSGPSGPPEPEVSVVVTPASDTVTVLASTQLTAVVSNASNQSVTWTVLEGAGAGTVSPTGLYTAGTTSGNFRVEARSVADAARADTALIRVVAAPAAGITALDTVLAGASFSASVPAQQGATYEWVVTGGTVTAGAGTRVVTITAGAGASVELSCTVTNLAGNEATENATVGVVQPPVITAFAAARSIVTLGSGTTLSAEYANGEGTVDGGIGALASGGSAATGPLASPTTYKLTVTGFRGVSVNSTVTVTTAPVPVAVLSSHMRSVAPGDSALLYFTGSGGEESMGLAPGPDPLPLVNYIWSEPLTVSTQFTLTVRNAADSVVTDTLTIPVVPRAAGTLSAVTPPSLLRGSAFLLADGRLLLPGSSGSPSDGASAELFDPATGVFTPTGSMSNPRSGPSGESLLDGRVLVTSDGTAELYDPASGTFSNTANSTRVTIPKAITRLPDGRVLLLGRNGYGWLADFFDPATDSFSPAANPPEMGYSFAAAEAGGTVLIAGGPGYSIMVETVVRFDPVTGTTTPVATLAIPRFEPAVVALADGRLLVAGGTTANLFTPVAPAEVVDPALNSATTAGEMGIPRSSFSAVLLGDGRVLLAGGALSYMGGVQGTEIYDPVTQTFSPGPSPQGMEAIVGVYPLLSGGALLLGDSEHDLTAATDVAAVFASP